MALIHLKAFKVVLGKAEVDEVLKLKGLSINN